MPFLFSSNLLFPTLSSPFPSFILIIIWLHPCLIGATQIYCAAAKTMGVTSHHWRGPYQSLICICEHRQPHLQPLWHSRNTHSLLPPWLHLKDLPPPQYFDGPTAMGSPRVLLPPSQLGADWGLNWNQMVLWAHWPHTRIGMGILFSTAVSLIITPAPSSSSPWTALRLGDTWQLSGETGGLSTTTSLHQQQPISKSPSPSPTSIDWLCSPATWSSKSWKCCFC